MEIYFLIYIHVHNVFLINVHAIQHLSKLTKQTKEHICDATLKNYFAVQIKSKKSTKGVLKTVFDIFELFVSLNYTRLICVTTFHFWDKLPFWWYSKCCRKQYILKIMWQHQLKSTLFKISSFFHIFVIVRSNMCRFAVSSVIKFDLKRNRRKENCPTSCKAWSIL